MRYTQIAASVLPLATQVLGSSVAEPRHDSPSAPLKRYAGSAELLQAEDLLKRATCGKDAGKCPDGQCCSEGGNCGTSTDFCKAPACQIDYSNGNCDSDEKPCGKSTEDIERNNDGDVPYGSYIKTCRKEGVVALTFDDGPYHYTTQVLDLLEKYDAKATFFVNGNNVGKGRIDDPDTEWPAILRRTYADGHQIASHTWSHLEMSGADDERRTSELIYNEMAIRNVLGFFPKYLRPPKGSCTIASGCMDIAVDLGYHVVTWDVDTKDFENNTPDTIQKAKDNFDAGFNGTQSRIVLAHDLQEQTAEELAEYMIKKVKDAGYEFVTVGECLNDAEENWYIKADIEEKCKISDSPNDDDDDDDDDDNSSDLEISQDGTCGDRSDGKNTCEGSDHGDCCSYNDWCGATSAYCDGGCQKAFGLCNERGPDDGLIVSQNGLCGGNTFQTCEGSSYGDCCSVHGNCGNTNVYCNRNEGCQSGFGLCN